MKDLEILSHEELLAIEGGVNWWQVAEGVGTLAAATGCYVTAASTALSPALPLSVAAATTGLGLQVAGYSQIAAGFASK
ncbi:hypothetical protein [Lysinibacillus xylanilyticus]|uniref:hypothetical protein n=1 Tax=Lysinibacillus xylanilyticus TaxID=582475 RepID=UPI0036DB436D